MKRTLGILAILAAGVGAAQAQYGQPSYQIRPNGMGDYGVFDSRTPWAPQGQFRSDGMGGYSYIPTPGYQPPPNPYGQGYTSEEN